MLPAGGLFIPYFPPWPVGPSARWPQPRSLPMVMDFKDCTGFDPRLGAQKN
nr:MAG TPA: hypothetical protein [Caudoviricetes sp.]